MFASISPARFSTSGDWSNDWPQATSTLAKITPPWDDDEEWHWKRQNRETASRKWESVIQEKCVTSVKTKSAHKYFPIRTIVGRLANWRRGQSFHKWTNIFFSSPVWQMQMSDSCFDMKSCKLKTQTKWLPQCVMFVYFGHQSSLSNHCTCLSLPGSCSFSHGHGLPLCITCWALILPI